MLKAAIHPYIIVLKNVWNKFGNVTKIDFIHKMRMLMVVARVKLSYDVL